MIADPADNRETKSNSSSTPTRQERPVSELPPDFVAEIDQMKANADEVVAHVVAGVRQLIADGMDAGELHWATMSNIAHDPQVNRWQLASGFAAALLQLAQTSV